MIEETKEQMEGEPTAVGQLSSAATSRRRFLLGSGVATGLTVLTACGGGQQEEAQPEQPATSPETADGDLAVAELAAGLEILAVDTYDAALQAAQAGKLGTVPPAVAEFVQTAKTHHQAHADAWNQVLEGAGRPRVTEPNAQLKQTVDAEFAKVTDVAGAAKLALSLEETASDTYNKAIPSLTSEDAVRQAAQIQVVDQQHRAILLYALGMYPVPEVFQDTDKAVSG